MDLTRDDTSDNWYGDLDQRHLYFGLTDELMTIAHSDHTANYQKDGHAYRSTDLSNNFFVRNGKADEWAEKYADRIQQHLDAKEESFSSLLITSPSRRASRGFKTESLRM